MLTITSPTALRLPAGGAGDGGGGGAAGRCLCGCIFSPAPTSWKRGPVSPFPGSCSSVRLATLPELSAASSSPDRLSGGLSEPLADSWWRGEISRRYWRRRRDIEMTCYVDESVDEYDGNNMEKRDDRNNMEKEKHL